MLQGIAPDTVHRASHTLQGIAPDTVRTMLQGIAPDTVHSASNILQGIASSSPVARVRDLDRTCWRLRPLRPPFYRPLSADYSLPTTLYRLLSTDQPRP